MRLFNRISRPRRTAGEPVFTTHHRSAAQPRRSRQRAARAPSLGSTDARIPIRLIYVPLDLIVQPYRTSDLGHWHCGLTALPLLIASQRARVCEIQQRSKPSMSFMYVRGDEVHCSRFVFQMPSCRVLYRCLC